MKIGIIGAMDVEIATLRKQMTAREDVTRAGMQFSCGKIGNTEVVVVQSGIGKVNAGCCVQILADMFHVTHIINTGVAGSLNNDINIGDIVVSTGAMYHDVDATVFGYQRGEIPQMGIVSFPADEVLRAAAVKAVKEAAPEVQVFEGQVLSGDQFISTREKKEDLMKNFSGYCAEMEGAAIAQASYINGIPYVIIRAISDKADESVEESYDVFEGKAAIHCANITQYMVSHLG
ncbi:MAG: 5'-methylthioadenosine/adenosylhomocysteine nucleosidase [Lachnospiraceae bacterium]|jgi:adenosylhomocysteine nucleosidase|nr:5'-methylthioadenosine/adenosylhomocysteine nucleosidase [Lachnospiraceae bacterium]MCI1398738.1 5'-methylthioadenosine/adenosylhomocysteine nucleosidase [Lachnospiraceae bacterium]MCI1424381.1 5'-methylthioadenosine/adenosylhomocysteine nucleosidase [Lachnospiraceae bacterium]MCI1453204.1 5'-methylthioadenosine/adenosylhomocysteine nucleosidase [Lachnospiraceae bacterium]MDD5849104.1 5'-methylthioadenosine/adenosylhomocysteine nucleosidase [Bacillota bacterium]